MKLILENWRKYIAEENGSTFVFHHAAPASLPPEKFKRLFIHRDPEELAGMQRINKLIGTDERVSPIKFNPREESLGMYGSALYGSMPGSDMAKKWARMRRRGYIYSITTSAEGIEPWKRGADFDELIEAGQRGTFTEFGEVALWDYESVHPENIELIKDPTPE